MVESRAEFVEQFDGGRRRGGEPTMGRNEARRSVIGKRIHFRDQGVEAVRGPLSWTKNAWRSDMVV